jgi:hypothetical protein
VKSWFKLGLLELLPLLLSASCATARIPMPTPCFADKGGIYCPDSIQPKPFNKFQCFDPNQLEPFFEKFAK